MPIQKAGSVRIVTISNALFHRQQFVKGYRSLVKVQLINLKIHLST